MSVATVTDGAPSTAAPPRLHLFDELAGSAADSLAALTDATPAMLFACSADGEDAWVNRQWLAYTGVPDADTLGTRWHEVTVAGDDSPLAAPSGGADRCVETSFRLRDAAGDYHWHLARARLARDAHGRVLFWAGVVQELSEQGPDAQAGPLDRDEFFALVSHELRSPLNAIRGWAEVLRKSGELSPMQQRALTTIDRNIAAQARLIDELVDRQRVLHGKVQLERQRIVLCELVTDIVDGMRPAAHEKRLELRTTCPDSVVIDGDAQRLRQVLVNLLSNAIKFTPPGGTIDVRAQDNGDHVLIELTDTGIGLSPEWLLRPSAKGAAPNGAGLGLAFAQRLVELHGGELTARSDGPDRGSTFTITLPAAHTQA